MSRASDGFRQVVCPCSGEYFGSMAEAARVMRHAGELRATVEGIYAAIQAGHEYCGRFWDFRFPQDWPLNRRLAASTPNSEP